MPRDYTASASGSFTAQVDIMEIVSAADAVTEIRGYKWFQSTDTDSEALGLEGYRGHTTSGSGGASNTPTPDDPGDSAFAGTAEVFNTTLATGGTPVGTHNTGWNVLAPDTAPPIPKSTWLNPSQRWVLRTTGAPADSLTGRIEVYLREYGS